MKYAPRNFSVKFLLLSSIKMRNLQNIYNYLEFLTEEEYTILSSRMTIIIIKTHYVMKYESRDFSVKFPLLTFITTHNLQKI